MFKNEDFKIDKDSEAYKLAKPTAANLEGFQSDQEEQEKEVEQKVDPKKEAKKQKMKEIEQKVSKMMGEDVEQDGKTFTERLTNKKEEKTGGRRKDEIFSRSYFL